MNTEPETLMYKLNRAPDGAISYGNVKIELKGRKIKDNKI